MSLDDHALRAILEPLLDVLVVRGPWVGTQDLRGLLELPAATVTGLDDPAAEVTGASVRDAIVLVVRDRAELRRVAAACQGLPSSTRLGCVLLEGADPPLTAGHPSWPRISSVTASSTPLCFTMVQLRTPLAAGRWAADLARRSTPSHLMSEGWPVVGLDRADPQLWTTGDPTSFVASGEELVDSSEDYPPDVVVLAQGTGGRPVARTGVHHVLGPLAGDVLVGPELTWSEYADLGGDERSGSLASGGPLALGGFDALLLNPTGYGRTPKEPVRDLVAVTSGDLCRVETEAGPVDLDGRGRLGERDVAALRPLGGVHVRWEGGAGPHGYCRLVVGLAMAGIPLTCEPVPPWAAALIAPDLLAAMSAPDRPAGREDDDLTREVRSIRLRRTAHARHSVRAWKDGVAARSGMAPARRPQVSVLLANRRPEQLGFALRQVAQQREVDLEVVLAAHGHEPQPARLADLARELGVRLTALSMPAAQPFGEVLHTAAGRAQGDILLKMDDDDWYGPDFVADLLLARAYSGADVVGTPPEFIYVEPLDVTVHRRDVSERFRSIVAGGTISVSRHAYEAVGGFRPTMRRSVDAGFLRSVTAAGGSVYRTQGHSYVLRRTGVGHTWDPGVGYFVSRARTLQQWRGFRPSPLLELVPPVPTSEDGRS